MPFPSVTSNYTPSNPKLSFIKKTGEEENEFSPDIQGPANRANQAANAMRQNSGPELARIKEQTNQHSSKLEQMKNPTPHSFTTQVSKALADSGKSGDQTDAKIYLANNFSKSSQVDKKSAHNSSTVTLPKKIDRVNALKILWDNSRPAAFFDMVPNGDELRQKQEEAAWKNKSNVDQTIESNPRVDYFGGRCIKTDFSKYPEIDVAPYKEDCNIDMSVEEIQAKF